ncbi:Filament-like plant protein 6 [Hibiscus syriacus]|uniref:Filament-like plant protein 6 n=1 Tax=Hibiscus syriacus TaxID=106335 RepID=A0A6A2YGM1_HIBSY|nr:filament-like plant protein 4 [Hibiscus syriacus]KAE8674617.1 Filament-like plant protein 6 [Hibiscus syriacus]
MDRHWPWKKKSSDKAHKGAATTAAVDPAASPLASAAPRGNEDTHKKPKYVQISVESYSQLTGLENQVKTYEEQVQSLEEDIKDLNGKLDAANSEISAKEDLVKQHSKVAEDAVSGWEKAEAEALALKNQLESVTLLKLTAEDRASHLDGALKECMRQIRNLKEEHEQKLQDVVVSKNKQCEKIKLELEAKIANLDQELLKFEAENAAISRSLQERSDKLIKISDKKSQAEAQIERLKGNIDSCEREINSLKYELHVVSKELEIRNEEKNMSMRSAEAANKQNIERVKNIAKLEAECQRLRGLVRKKLPGPAALAQMKLEVESLGRDYGDTRLKRSPVRPSTPHMSPVSDFSLDNAQRLHKENEFLTERLLAMEEETKMLKEGLAKRNSELLASRSLCAKTSSKLLSLEAQFSVSNQQRSPLKAIVQIPAEVYSSQNASTPPSVTSVSEDGIDDDRSCAESWATALVSELSQFKKAKIVDRSYKTDNSKHLDLMDDFLEMEQLACSTNDSATNGAIGLKLSETVNGDSSEKQHDLSPSENDVSSKMDSSVVYPESDVDKLPFMKLRTRLSVVLESITKDADVQKILEDIKCAVQDIKDGLSQHSTNGVSEELHGSDGTCNGQVYPEVASLTAEKEIAMSQGDKLNSASVQTLSQELASAISQIHDFVLYLGDEEKAVDDISFDGIGLSHKIGEFSVTYNKALCSNISLDDFIFDLSSVLAKASEVRLNVFGYKGNEVEINSPDCIDKTALPENKVTQNGSSGGIYQNSCVHISSPTSNPEVPNDGNLVSDCESKQSSKFSSEEFEEMKLEKERLAMDLSQCIENLEMTKSKLQETELLLTEAKSELASAQKSNSLAETQLKCMAESYRSLESRAVELETEANLLRAKIETIENELQDEKKSHYDALTRCMDLEEHLQKNEKCSGCSSAAEAGIKSKQEKELAAATEKLAECQETIFLLGKQLKALRPPTETKGSPYNERITKVEGFREDETTTGNMNLHDLNGADVDTAGSGNASRSGAESPTELSFNTPCSPSDTEANLLKSPINSYNSNHKSTISSSSSCSSTPTPEKQSRGFSRFFSSKGKNGH